MEEHIEHLPQFFQVLQENGLTINPSKCTFASTSVKFLGHMVSESGIIPLPKHVSAVQEFPPETTPAIPRHGKLLPPISVNYCLHLETAYQPPKRKPKTLGLVRQRHRGIRRLIAAVPPSHPAPDAVIALAVDASDSPSSSWRTLHGDPSHFSPKICLHWNADIQRSTENSWLLTQQYGISAFCSRATHLSLNGPQTSCRCHEQNLTAVVCKTTKTDVIPCRIHGRLQAQSRVSKCRR
jgi:hypothetical protein